MRVKKGFRLIEVQLKLVQQNKHKLCVSVAQPEENQSPNLKRLLFKVTEAANQCPPEFLKCFLLRFTLNFGQHCMLKFNLFSASYVPEVQL